MKNATFFSFATINIQANTMGRTGGRINRLVNTKPEKGAPDSSSSDSDMSLEKATFKRVKPRLGSQYQTKVTRFEHSLQKTPHHHHDHCSERPLPDLMSIEHPHISKQEAQSSAQDEHGEFSIGVRGSQSLARLDEAKITPTVPHRADGTRLAIFSRSHMAFCLFLPT